MQLSGTYITMLYGGYETKHLKVFLSSGMKYFGKEGVMRDNNIKINHTGTVYSVQCIKFEPQQGAATNKQRNKK